MTAAESATRLGKRRSPHRLGGSAGDRGAADGMVGRKDGIRRVAQACSGEVEAASHLHDFRLFPLRKLFHAPNLVVGHLLHFFKGALLFVLADLFFLGQFL